MASQLESVTILPLKIFRNASKEWVYITGKDYLVTMVILKDVDSIDTFISFTELDADRCICYGYKDIPCIYHRVVTHDRDLYPLINVNIGIHRIKQEIIKVVKNRNTTTIMGLLNETSLTKSVMFICSNGITELEKQCDCFFHDQDFRQGCDIKTCMNAI